MSIISLLGVKVLNNPANFSDPYEFEITFECLEQLHKDLEWKLTYVGSATSSEHDQELDSLLVGPIPVGVNKFIFEADAPDLKRIPASEILGVTVILLTCSYDSREFVRVGYYVNNEYDSEELNAEPPAKPVMEHVRRNILAEKPRDSRDSADSAPAEYPPEQPEADVVEDDGTAYGAEEVELEEALIKEEAALTAQGEDEEMAGADDTAGQAAKAEDDESDAGSEDLEAESSGSEDDEVEEEEGEGDGDEDMEMAEDGDGKPTEAASHNGQPIGQQQQHGEVMVH
ncbi:MAG: hypothetical protein Q9187_001667 [Circinaria calcarea]